MMQARYLDRNASTGSSCVARRAGRDTMEWQHIESAFWGLATIAAELPGVAGKRAQLREAQREWPVRELRRVVGSRSFRPAAVML
ncbi:MAG: hypothetical protein ACREMA_00650, partial [Longimicrobiales bacterium]